MNRQHPPHLTFARRPTLDVNVQRFEVHQVLSGLWDGSAIFSVRHEENLGLETLLDTGIAFEIRQGPDRTRRWTGVCTQLIHMSHEPTGLSYYRVTFASELVRLTHRKNIRVFQEVSLPNIVLQVLRDWGHNVLEVSEEVVEDEAGGHAVAKNPEPDQSVVLYDFDPNDEKRFPKHEFRVQYEESDAAFVSRLLEESGLTYYFEYTNGRLKAPREGAPPEPTNGHALTRLAIDGEPQSREPWRIPYIGTSEAPSFDLPEFFAANATIGRMVLPGAVTLRDHDFRSTLGAKHEARAVTELNDTAESLYEQFDYAPGRLQTFKTNAEGERYQESAQPADDGLHAGRTNDYTLTFESNAIDLAPGMVVAFDNKVPAALEAFVPRLAHPRAELAPEQKHLVVSVDIEGDSAGPSMVRCGAVSAMKIYRPLARTGKPRINGLQSALVVGGPDDSTPEQIHEDKTLQHRVRIQFHWDRQHLYGKPVEGPEGENLQPVGSCWVRWGTPWAGSGNGWNFVPRVGQEVLVSFLDGDPDQPIILRALHSPENPPPFSPTNQNTVTGLRSNTAPGGGGYNELAFDDASGKERIHMQAENALSSIVKSTEARDVGTVRKTSIGSRDVLHVGKQWELVVGQKQVGIIVNEGRMLVQVGGEGGSSVEIKDGSIHFNTKQEIHLHAGTVLHLSAGGTMNIDSGIPTHKVDINPPSRKPHTPDEIRGAMPTYLKAEPPQPGARHGGTVPAIGGGGMPSPPGEVLVDVDLAEPPEPPKPPAVPPPTDAEGSSALPPNASNEDALRAFARSHGMPFADAPITQVAPGIKAWGDADFTARVQEDLQKIGSTQVGRNLLGRLAATGKTTVITPFDKPNGGAGPFDLIGATAKGVPVSGLGGPLMSMGQPVLGTGVGSDSFVQWNPYFQLPNSLPYAPPMSTDAILLHELSHASRYATGTLEVKPHIWYGNVEEMRAIREETEYFRQTNYDYRRTDHGTSFTPDGPTVGGG